MALRKLMRKAQAPQKALKFLPIQGWHKVGDTTIDPLLDFIGNDVLSDWKKPNSAS